MVRGLDGNMGLDLVMRRYIPACVIDYSSVTRVTGPVENLGFSGTRFSGRTTVTAGSNTRLKGNGVVSYRSRVFNHDREFDPRSRTRLLAIGGTVAVVAGVGVALLVPGVSSVFSTSANVAACATPSAASTAAGTAAAARLPRRRDRCRDAATVAPTPTGAATTAPTAAAPTAASTAAATAAATTAATTAATAAAHDGRADDCSATPLSPRPRRHGHGHGHGRGRSGQRELRHHRAGQPAERDRAWPLRTSSPGPDGMTPAAVRLHDGQRGQPGRVRAGHDPEPGHRRAVGV